MHPDLLLALGTAAAGGAVASATATGTALLDAANLRVGRELHAEADAAGMDARWLPHFLRLWRAATAAALFVGWVILGMPPVALFIAFLVDRLGPLWVRFRIDAHKKAVSEQVVFVARLLGGQVRIGMSLEEALESAAAQTPDPLGAILRRAGQQLAQGKTARDVLADLKERVRLEAVAVLAIALQVAVERGGKLGPVLDRIGHSLEELHRVERKRDADTAAGRLMVLLMSLFPAAFLGLFYFLDPELIGVMFDTLAGQVVLAAIGLIVYASVRWAGRILANVGGNT